ncbi:hypothetical protein OUZ56_030844 [Daphnia magna]|uniref:Uncharacterized protein n=1 Tax=Daphnia magna TaxID=35525 RepID=A0ABQ9ZSG8_9CRUS|nr:hypothetical protein OUZ56_030844 [Daphnia magna]
MNNHHQPTHIDMDVKNNPFWTANSLPSSAKLPTKQFLQSSDNRELCHLLLLSHAKLKLKIISLARSSLHHPSSPRVRPVFARHPIFVSPVAPSSSRPSPRLRLARRPVFASPVAPSSPRPSPRRRLVVAPSLPLSSWYRCILLCVVLINPLAATHFDPLFFLAC